MNLPWITPTNEDHVASSIRKQLYRLEELLVDIESKDASNYQMTTTIDHVVNDLKKLRTQLTVWSVINAPASEIISLSRLD